MNKHCLGELSVLQKTQSRKFYFKNQGSTHEGILIFKEGTFYAYKNRCAHIPLPLDWGDDQFFNEDESFLLCRNHGALFDFKTGSCIDGPCSGKSLESMPLIIQDCKLYVEIIPD